jgi:hypothetical protein
VGTQTFSVIYLPHRYYFVLLHALIPAPLLSATSAILLESFVKPMALPGGVSAFLHGVNRRSQETIRTPEASVVPHMSVTLTYDKLEVGKRL